MKGCIRGHRGSVLEAARLLSAGIHHQNIALNDDVDSSDRFVISAKNLINKVLARGSEMICPRHGSSTVAYMFLPPVRLSWIQKSRRIYVHPQSDGQQWLSCRQPACL